MARAKSQFVCQECGAVSPRWVGRCDSCGAWNALAEEAGGDAPPKGLGSARGRTVPLVGLKGEEDPPARRVSGISELDRVCGGGLVPGSALLVGGDPGIGKSTLLMQLSAALAPGHRVIYISGEEAIEQLRLRARRLGLDGAPVLLAAATNVRDIVTTLEAGNPPGLVVIDSIQTLYLDTLDSVPGSVAQVRGAAQELIRLAKTQGFTLILVGHVTKEGTIAGPRLLEHMVDTVLYFEGERGHNFRILRAVKNRFGATDEIGVFEMTDRGLAEVPDPSALFLADRRGAVSGSTVFAGIEGSRPMLVEIQALLAPTPQATPRRAVVGWDSGRLAMIMAVLEARCGLRMSGLEVYLNVAGGLRVGEPAADLAVAAALVSALHDVPVPAETVIFGEIGLSGEVRPVSRADARLREAGKLGFNQAISPRRRSKEKAGRGGEAKATGETKLNMLEVGHVQEIIPLLGGGDSGKSDTGKRNSGKSG